jgi:hypothetical protein
LRKQSVVIRGCQSDLQIAQGFQNVSALRFKRTGCFPQPAAILAPIGRAEFAGDLLGGGEHVIEVAGINFFMDTPQPLLVDARQGFEFMAMIDAVMQESAP